MSHVSKAQAVADAWNNPGPNPQFHRASQEALAHHWPTLSRAVSALAKALGPSIQHVDIARHSTKDEEAMSVMFTARLLGYHDIIIEMVGTAREYHTSIAAQWARRTHEADTLSDECRALHNLARAILNKARATADLITESPFVEESTKILGYIAAGYTEIQQAHSAALTARDLPIGGAASRPYPYKKGAENASR